MKLVHGRAHLAYVVINSTFLICFSLCLCDENQTTKLYFKGQNIWEAIIADLLPKGLGKARKVYIYIVTFYESLG